MAKSNAVDNSKFKLKAWHYVAGVLVILLIYLVVFHFISPQPNIAYFSKVMNKIGAPNGYTYSPSGDQIEPGGIGASAYYIRIYNGGKDSLESMRAEMLARVKNAGFPNARWNGEALPHSARVNAYCDVAGVNVYFSPGNHSSIEVEVHANNDSYFKTNCPWF